MYNLLFYDDADVHIIHNNFKYSNFYEILMKNIITIGFIYAWATIY